MTADGPRPEAPLDEGVASALDAVAEAGMGPTTTAHSVACLHLDAETRRDASLRLKSAKGHLEGVLRMLEDPDVYCVDVLKQVKAVQGALSKIGERVLRSHIRDHVTTAAERGDTEAIVEELMEALKYQARI